MITRNGDRNRDRNPRRLRDQRGAVAVEFVVLVPALMLMLGLVLSGGRIWFVRAALQNTAESAARAASLARTPGQAELAAQSVVDAGLDDSDLHCTQSSVLVSTNAFYVPVGRPATILSDVTCVVSLGDILLPGLPGSLTLHATGSSALDTYRGRR